MAEPKITGGIYYPNYNWDKILGGAKVDSKAQAEYEAQMAKYLQAKETMLKKGYTIDSNNGGVISFSQVARITIGPDGKAVETIIPRGSSTQASKTTIGDALVNYTTSAEDYPTVYTGCPSTPTYYSSATESYPTTGTTYPSNSTEEVVSPHQEQDFSDFKGDDVIKYNSKTNEDMTEARQALLNAGYIKVGTDKDGKEYYEKRIPSTGNLSKEDNSSVVQSITKTDCSIPETTSDAVTKCSGTVSSEVSIPKVVNDPCQAGAIKLNINA